MAKQRMAHASTHGARKLPGPIFILVQACATHGGGRSEAGHCFHLLFLCGPGLLACATHGGGRSEAGHCFHLLFFLFFFLLHLLLFTHFGESPVTENLFPLIFWHN